MKIIGDILLSLLHLIVSLVIAVGFYVGIFLLCLKISTYLI